MYAENSENTKSFQVLLLLNFLTNHILSLNLH